MKRIFGKLLGSVLVVWCFLLGVTITAQAKVTEEQKQDYTNTLCRVIRDGDESAKLNSYQNIYKTSEGKKCLKKAVLENRAVLIAEGIDGLDSSWKNYYKVKKQNNEVILVAEKSLRRSTYEKRYQKVQNGLKKILGQVDKGMNSADKAMAVYTYLAKNITYVKSVECHSGYDVLVNNMGVCDGLANVYAMAMKALDIPCFVVSDFKKDHSWNMVYLSGKWYLCDLTIGVGNGSHRGMAVSYESCLVGVDTFLKHHPGYTKNTLYGQDNSDGYNIKNLKIATSDYIKEGTGFRNALDEHCCTFYQKGYWYWISTGNVLKKSKLNGSGTKTVFVPEDEKYIGWIDSYNGSVILSLNETIYRYEESKKQLLKIFKVPDSEYHMQASSYFWQIACISRFTIAPSGKLSYYVTDLKTTKPGSHIIYLGAQSTDKVTPQISKESVSLVAGRFRQLFVYNMQAVDNKTIKWTSSNKKVAIVDKYGYVRGVEAGKAVISAKYNGVTVKCNVTVTGYTMLYKDCYINGDGNLYTLSGDDKFVLATPKRSGYTFKGWYEDKKYKKRVKSIKKGNKKLYTLYAKWVKK